jgi:general secretion pathway protein C
LQVLAQRARRLRMPRVPEFAQALIAARTVARAPWMASALLALALIAELVLAVRPIWTRAPAVSAPARPLGTTGEPSVNLEEIIGARLFGVAPVASAPVAATGPLVLTGTLALAVPEKGYAVIGETATHSQLYAVGAALPGGATLVAVYPLRAVIQRYGVLESLVFEKHLAGDTAPSRRVAGSMPAALPSLEERTTVVPVAEVSATVARPMRNRSTRERVVEYFRPVASRADGEHQGMRIDPVQLVSGSELRSGDLLTRIAGVAVNSSAGGDQLGDALLAGAPFAVAVWRDGEEVEITVDPHKVRGLGLPGH